MSQTMDKLGRQVLGKFLADKRKQAGITQAALAKTLGFETAQYISNIERGMSTPSPNILQSLIDYLEIDPREYAEVYSQETEKSLLRMLKQKHFQN